MLAKTVFFIKLKFYTYVPSGLKKGNFFFNLFINSSMLISHVRTALNNQNGTVGT